MTRLRPVLALLLAAIVGAWAWRTFHAASPQAAAAAAADPALTVFYLHAAFRCATCNRMEADTRQALATWQPPPGQARPRLDLRNYLDVGNEEFTTRFGVNASSVLLAEVTGGRIVRGELLFDVGSVPADTVQALHRGLDRFVAGAVAAPAPAPRHRITAWVEAATGLSGRALVLLAALALGLVTAVMPCPLATNVAAMSFLARKAGKVRAALLGGLAYALGRTAAYVGLGLLLGAGLVQVPAVNRFLSVHLNSLLGPLLILVAIPLLRLWSPTWTLVSGEKAQRLGGHGGWAAAFALGVVFALAFCPTSAALFLGGLLPLMAGGGELVLPPLLYGLGTAAPVVFFAVLLAVAADAASRAFARLTALEPVFRWLTGLVFLGVGLWYVVIVLTA